MRGMKQAVTPEIVAEAARTLTDGTPTGVVELLPRGTLRSFMVQGPVPLTIRVDEDPAGRRVDVEARAFVALQTATDPPVVPALRTRHVLFGKDGIERRFLAYDWVDGKVLSAPVPRARAAEVGRLFARLHGARVMDLWGRLPEGRLSLLDAYKKTVDELRAWIALREQDGLGHDLLTLSLSDLQRGLRAVVVAQDNGFRTRRRRVLCHGDADPSYVIARKERGPLMDPLTLVGLDRANLGDAAFDAAHFTVAAALDDDAEDDFLNAYADTSASLDRKDGRFVERYFACKTLELLARPIARLERISRIKRGTEPVLDDAITVLERESEAAIADVAQALTSLKDIAGRARPTSVAEVRAMGRIVAIEDLVLAGRSFRIALTGEPYTGKTEVGAVLARRLGHAFLSMTALSRALALVAHEEKLEIGSTGREVGPRALVRALFDRGFVMEPLAEPPFYRITLDDVEITERLREPDRELKIKAGALLDDDVVRAALKDELERRFAGQGIVVEGVFAESVLGNRVRSFHLTGDAAGRQARLMAHRADVRDQAFSEDARRQDPGSSSAGDVTEAEAAALLARLDKEAPKAPADAVHVDVGSRPAAAAALAVLVHLLPASRRGAPDLSNRAPL